MVSMTPALAQSVLSSTSERQMKELRFRFSLMSWSYQSKLQNQEIGLGSHGNFKRRGVWVFIYYLDKHTPCKATSFSWSPEIILQGPLAAVEIPIIAHTCLIFHFSIKLLFSPETCQLPPGFRYPAFQAPESPGWALGVEVILEPSFCLSSSHWQLLSQKVGIWGRKGPFPQIQITDFVIVCNYCFTTKLVPSPTKIHDMQKELQESLLSLESNK